MKAKSVSRRNFLKLTLAALPTVWLSACEAVSVERTVPTQVIKGDSERVDVIVIGAGVAGLAAARKLAELNYDVIVLEARNRPGGRVYSDRSWEDITLDMGASWVQGEDGNPLSKIIQQQDIRTAVFDYEALWAYDDEGYEFEDAELEQIDEAFESMMGEVDDFREARGKLQMSLRHGIDQVLSEWNLDEEEKIIMEAAINANIEHEYAADVEELSLLEYDQEEALGGDDLLFLDGYDQVVHALASGLDLRLEHVVQSIAYDQSGVVVRTDQGDFKTHRAIITLPLGVLKHGAVKFEPPLPAEKQQAIQRLGMGVLNKLYLRFPEVFWPEEADLLGFFSERRDQWVEWVNMAKFSGMPVLLGFNAGSFGRQLEKMSDPQVVNSAMQALREMFGEDIPDSTAWMMTRWGADPFAGGSYSFVAKGTSGSDLEVLAEAVQNVLFFAGEATTREYPATVHGALMSGERAAGELDETWD